MKQAINSLYIPILLAALSQGVMWVGVFSLIHSGPLAYVGGIPAGLAIVWIITRSANQLPRIQAKRARQAGWVFLVLVIAIEPVVLGVVNWWSMPATFQSLFASYLVAGGASLIISLVLVMGALVDRSLVPVEKVQKSVEVPTESNASAGTGRTKSKKSAKVQAEPVALSAQSVAPVAQSVAHASKYPRECGVGGCTYVLKNAQSVGGHMKAKHPAALGIFEPMQKEQAK